MKKVLLSLSLLIACVSLKSQCSELFFSRYIQLGQNNKAFEIYNPTPNPINLTGYRIERWKSNSSGLISTTMNDSVHLTAGAMIPAYGTWTITNPETVPNSGNSNAICSPALYATGDQHGNFYGTYGSTTGDPTYFKGNDCLILRNPAGNIIDVFGEIGVTVTYWSTLPTYRGGIGEGKWVSKGYLLERRPSVNSGVTSIPSSFNPMAQWDTIPKPLTSQDTLDTYAIMGSPFTSVCMVGIESHNILSRVTVYPNPSNTGSVTVKSSEIISEVKLFNITGQLISTDSGINKNQCTISTEKLPKGNYLLQVTFSNGFTERKNLNIE